MSHDMSQWGETFREEAAELLDQMEESLLELEDNPDNKEEINKIFRALHTIKGSGSMFGFDRIAGFTHELEAAFDLLRNDKIAVSHELLQLTLQSHDLIGEMLEKEMKGEPIESDSSKAILDTLKVLLSGSSPATNTTPAPKPAEPQPETTQPTADATTGGKVTYKIQFVPDKTFFHGNKILPLFRELNTYGELTASPHLQDLPLLNSIDPEECYVFWDLRLTTTKSLEDIQDVFMFVEDACQLEITPEEETDTNTDNSEIKPTAPAKLEEPKTPIEPEVSAVQEKQQEPEPQKTETPPTAPSPSMEQKAVRKTRKKTESESAATIRVSSEKLDTLVDLVGELTTMQAHISQLSQSRADHELTNIAEGFERLTAELRDNTMDMRMVPVGTMFNKFRRLVRDLSLELGKKITMVTGGEETEMDKTIIEQLNDPMVHLIRNCIDHGIESPDERVASGKFDEGTIQLSAIHEGSNILIRIRDDGKGINSAAVRKRAIEKGIIQEDTQLTEQELANLIFHPGFSTAEKVTNISGRGVGMDVVRRNIEALRGSIELNSKAGEGTTITLRLPLTLTLIDGLLVRIGKNFYIFTLSEVEECVALVPDDTMELHGQPSIRVREMILPYISLRDLFNVKEEPPPVEQVVISQIGSRRVGFAVDLVVGEYQAVIKPLEKILKGKEKFSGTTILGDGTVALIFNIQELARSMEKMNRKERREIAALNPEL